MFNKIIPVIAAHNIYIIGDKIKHADLKMVEGILT